MTGEGKNDTERFMERLDATYGWAYDEDGELGLWFDVYGIPEAVLVSPVGEILWRGHPGLLEESVVEAALEGALAPMWEWPKEARQVAKELAAGDWADALEDANELEAEEGSELARIARFVREAIDAKSAALVALHEKGDYLRAYEAADVLRKSLRGLPEGDVADEIRDEIKRDKRSWAIARAQLAIREIWADRPRSRDDLDEHIEDLGEIVADLPGTIAATEARHYIDRFEEMRPNMPF